VLACFSLQRQHKKFKKPNIVLYNFQKSCIEYDGRQHFEPIDFFGGNDGLKYIQINDAIKNKYCEDNGIKLIRIRYDENAYEILKEIL
jgi:hypothetical protein